MNDGMERRALLLHLGDVLESVACVAKCGDEYATLAEAFWQETALADFSILSQVGTMRPSEYVKRATGAYFLWPRMLLDEEINCAALANLVQNDLFVGNQAGWDQFVDSMRQLVPWFGEGLGPVKPADEDHVEMWPPETDR